MIAISVFGAMIGVLLGLRSTALALISAVLLLTAIAAGYGLATHQSGMAFLTGFLAALVVPQIGFAFGNVFQEPGDQADGRTVACGANRDGEPATFLQTSFRCSGD